MKFRAKISKDNLVALHSIVLTLERLAGNAAVFLNEESVRISLISESIDAPR
jgi:hypothetical protein